MSPLDLAWTLLKNVDEVQLCPSCQGVGFGGSNDLDISEEQSEEWGVMPKCRSCAGTGLAYDERFHPQDTTNEYPAYDPSWPYPTDKKIGQTVPDAQKTEDGKPITLTGDTQGWLASRPKPIKMRTNSQGQPSFMHMPFAGANKEMKNPAAEIFRRSEPFDLAWAIVHQNSR